VPVDISVVIPTFQRPRLLAEALESVLSQGGATIDVLVVDDGPGREGEPVVSGLRDPRVRYVPMDTPTGGNPSRVRNAGWRLTEGRLLHFLDDDDRVEPDAYREVLAAFEAAPTRGVVIGRVRPFGDDPGVVAQERKVFATAARRARILSRIGSRFLSAAHQLFAMPTILINSACMVRREVVARVDGYDEEIVIMEDIDFYARAIRDAGFTFLDRPFIGYRKGAPSIMHDNGDKSVAPSFDRMYEKYSAAHGSIELRLAHVLAKAVLTHL
jgi:GT2 family glycosyltransferase